MVGGVCRLANPMVVERVARLRRDDILILTINSRFAPGRSIVVWNAANIHVHTIGEDNGFELNLILLFAVIGILLDFVHSFLADVDTSHD